ncbi:MAG: prepilin-type N-terminal cleavage/methylation domain-containing protein [Candidatus Marinamargulisbacteria bacterium]|jgi:prepilin-type N-terminal cleavage/methylation domain-containing protein
MASNNSEKGFTMIELVVVLVLIGLIAGIAIPKYLDVTTNAKEKTLKGSITSIRDAVHMHYAKSIQDGTVAFPSLNATIFQDGSVPADVYTPTNSVTLTTENPISTFSGAGGWLYNEITGEVRANLPTYSTW